MPAVTTPDVVADGRVATLLHAVLVLVLVVLGIASLPLP
jgi:hypothetical protein